MMFILLLSSFAFANENWARLIDENGGAGVQFGAEIEASPSYSRNGATEFAPASNAKLFTYGFALETLGPDFTFPTVLDWWQTSEPGVAANVRLTGFGDPSWGLGELGETIQTRVTQIAKALVAAGVHQIEGDVQVLESNPRWSQLSDPAGWQSDDLVSCDGALPQAFNVSINCSTYTVTSLTNGHWNQAGLNEPVTLDLTPSKTTRVSVARLSKEHPEQGFRIHGSLKKNGKVTVTLPVMNVKAWVHNLLVSALRKQGVIFLPTTSKVAGAMQEIVFHSPPLKTIGKVMMKNSVNLLAETLFKYLGLARASGEVAMAEYLTGVGLGGKVTLHDGSGLSRSDRVSPEDLLKYLFYIRTRPSFPALWEALPIAGVDGTLKNRMKRTSAAGHLRAKTGTLNGVYNLSGFVPQGNTFVPFVMLTQTSASQSQVARGAEDRVGAELTRDLRTLRDEEIESMVRDPQTLLFIPEHAGQDSQ